MLRNILISLFVVLGLVVSGANASQPPVYAEDGVAINGYDPVAYLEHITAVEGKDEFSFDWMGATWKFSSQENLDKFIASPEDYAPQYGGYCAYAVANGYTATTDPDAFTVHEGKLYLNYSQWVSRLWRLKMNRFIEQGDENWPGVLE